MQYHAIPYDAMRYNGIICIFGPKTGNFRQSGPYNGLPSSRMGTNRKTKGIQSYLRIWGWYDPIELCPSEPKKVGLYGCSVKKIWFSGQKCYFSARNPFFSDIVQKFCSFHDWTPKRQHFCVDPVARRASGRPPGLFAQWGAFLAKNEAKFGYLLMWNFGLRLRFAAL